MKEMNTDRKVKANPAMKHRQKLLTCRNAMEKKGMDNSQVVDVKHLEHIKYDIATWELE